MKKILLLLTLSTIVFFGCKQKEPLAPYYPPDSGALVYTIEGVRDTSVEQTGQVKLTLFIKKTSGTAESIGLSVTGLPAGAQYVFSPAAGTVSYYSVITFNTLRVKAGNYPIQIVGAGATSGIKTMNMTLKVLPYSNPAVGLAGYFTETGNCSQSGAKSNTVNVDTTGGVPNKIKMLGFYAGGTLYNIMADISPNTKTLTIPAQTLSSATFQGSGTYTDSTITVNYTVSNAVLHDTCTAVLKR